MSRVSWDEQDCGEMPLLASEKIAKLQAENKAIKESNEGLLVILNDALNDVILNRGSKNAFFVCRTDMNERRNNMPGWTKIAELVIQKSQATNEKEK